MDVSSRYLTAGTLKVNWCQNHAYAVKGGAPMISNINRSVMHLLALFQRKDLDEGTVFDVRGTLCGDVRVRQASLTAYYTALGIIICLNITNQNIYLIEIVQCQLTCFKNILL